MIISPQLGHGNFVASVPGVMIRWHEVHVGTLIVVVVFSVTLIPRRCFGMGVLLYMCCVLVVSIVDFEKNFGTPLYGGWGNCLKGFLGE